MPSTAVNVPNRFVRFDAVTRAIPGTVPVPSMGE
jgi:hypothetical protein